LRFVFSHAFFIIVERRKILYDFNFTSYRVSKANLLFRSPIICKCHYIVLLEIFTLDMNYITFQVWV
jgi:hypothetical protein